MSGTLTGTVASEHDDFGTRDRLDVGGKRWNVHRLDTIAPAHLPLSLRVVLENLLRHQDGSGHSAAQIEALRTWDGERDSGTVVELRPSRVFLHDTNGVPAVADLAAMRDAVAALGGDPGLVNPLVPAELVIDHSVIADEFGHTKARLHNVELEYLRNSERYEFLRWGQKAFRHFTVVPPGTGIMHQINLERLAQVVTVRDGWVFPDVCLGTDSHTTMVNGLGVLGWGIGGIEAEAAMLGQSLSFPLPEVVGVRLDGVLPAAVTTTDLVLTLTELLRAHGVVGKIVEFHGPGLDALTVEDRATIANMSPEFGSTAGFFPIDDETLRYLRFTGRPDDHVALVEAYAKMQGLWRRDRGLWFSSDLRLDLTTVVPSLAGPRRPQDRTPLTRARSTFQQTLPQTLAAGTDPSAQASVHLDGTEHRIGHGAVAIAAITSCTNTSNPAVMVAAGLLARNAAERGLTRAPWVKTTLSPGSRVVMDYYADAGLTPHLEALGFHLAGFGCMTCIGASGPLIPEVSEAVRDHGLSVAAVLSGNRNFEGRIQPEVRMNYLASPPLVVAYAIAGTMDIDLTREPLGHDQDGRPVLLADIWPDEHEVADIVATSLRPEMFTTAYESVFDGDARWRDLSAPQSRLFPWNPASTYLRKPTHLDDFTRRPRPVQDIEGARVLVKLGDSVTTDHISPAGAIPARTPAGEHLTRLGVPADQLNTYASRRGNHEVMMRGAFANVRLRNHLTPDVEGGYTNCDGTTTTIYEAAETYRRVSTPVIVIAGRNYGAGSSRDWAAKGPTLLGVRAVLACDFERIHRSNLVGMGILPLQFLDGQDADTLGLTGHETYTITGLTALDNDVVPLTATVTANGTVFQARIRLDTPREVDYYRNGGITPYVLRELLTGKAEAEAT
ncbi:aconitate hydratase AcnA [Actinomadura napierensis]|uniref:Aconitate hydratase n=1 Tax=Actinomadura napierensis TaxID=267854 RepID=A0ABN2ZL73_9ACTN